MLGLGDNYRRPDQNQSSYVLSDMSSATQQAQPDELIGRVLNDRFRMISVIARGGMGRVYKAEQVPLGRIVAVKTLDPRNNGSDGDPQFQQRFFLEASVASKLQHPNTVTVFDYGRTSDGVFFIAMELVEGQSLLTVIREAGKLDAARTVHIALQIARSLREAHRFDVIHRDLKPGNVLLTQHGDEDDFVKVLDFGLVKHVETEAHVELTKAGLFMGSPKYMSPEQIRGDHVDARCDIYALGACMYEMLTGKVPFDRENTVKILMAHMHEAVKPITDPAVPPALNDLVLRCLSKQAEERPASMDELILLLKQSTGGPVLMSGQFPLSQEIRLGGTLSPGSQRMMPGTPSQPFVAGTHPLAGGTPSAGFNQNMLTPGGMAHPSLAPQAGTPGMMPVQAAPAPSASWLPKAVVVGALVIAAGFLALRFREQSTAAPPAAAITPVTAPAVPAPPPNTPPVVEAPAPTPPTSVNNAQRHAVVRITSTPAGATVSIDGRPYGTTPADIELWGDAVEPGKEIRFHFEKDGFDSTTVSRVVRGDQLAVDAMLQRSGPAPGPRVVRRPQPQQQPVQRPVVIKENFKEDPY